MSVLIYGEPEGGDPLEVVQLEESNGVWSAEGPLTWEGCYYVYEVYVYHPSTLEIAKCIANDPYARGYAGCISVHLNSYSSKMFWFKMATSYVTVGCQLMGGEP